MSDFYLVDPQGWEYDLQSVYSAYMGYFQLHAVPWYDHLWGQFFETFQQFLAFSWPVVTVTDTRTGRAHIVTRMSSITAFVTMIKTRFGETLPNVDNILLIKPLEISERYMRHVSEWSGYRKLHATLPAVALAAFKARVRAGDPAAIRDLWATHDETFLALDFECLSSEKSEDSSSSKNDKSPASYVTITEFGYAVIRSSHLVAAGAWPPVPDENYRKGHYVVSERAASNWPSSGSERAKLPPPGVSWQYAFGDSQVVSKAKLPCIIRCVLSSLLSPDSESVANKVVLVGHGVHTIFQRLEEMKIKLPSNVLVLDVAYLERALYNTGERGQMVSRKTGLVRMPESLLTLGGVLHALGIPLPPKGCTLHNAGNDAFMTLVAFQRMVDARGGAGIGGEASVVSAGARAWTWEAGVNGDRASKDAGTSAQGRGHVMRAATVAARFFRTRNGNKDISALPQAQNQTQNEKGHVLPQSQPQQTWASVCGADEMGMAVHAPSLRSSSMMSMQTMMTTATMVTTKTAATTQPVVTVKNSKPSKTLLPRLRRGETGAEEKVNEKAIKKEKEDDHDRGHDGEKTSMNWSGTGSGTGGGTSNGDRWWISPLSVSPSMSPSSSLRVKGGPGSHRNLWRHSSIVEMQRM